MATLPERPGSYTLTRDTKFLAADLRRFLTAGGHIETNRFRVTVEGEGGTGEMLAALRPRPRR